METDITNLTPEQKTAFQNKLDTGLSNPQAAITQVAPTTINSSNLGGSTPVTLPPPPQPTYQATPTVVPPANSQVNNGIATLPPPPQPSEYQQTLDQLGALGGTLATKGQVTTDLQNQYGLADKTTAAVNSYNAYNQAKLDFQQQQEKLASTGNTTDSGRQAALSEFSRAGNANLANLAIQAQADQGLLSAAQQTIQFKLDAQFKPVQDQIDYLKSFAELNQNDLTKSQQVQLENQRFVLQNNLDQLKSAKSSANNFALQQGMADPTTLAKIDAAQTPAEAYAAVGGQNGLPPTFGISNTANKYVDHSSDGVPYVDQSRLQNLTSYQKQQVSAEYANAGIRVLDPQDVQAITTIDEAKQTLNQFENTADKLLSPGLLGRLKGLSSNQVAQFLQGNPEWRQFQTLRAGLIKSVQGVAAGAPGLRVTGAELSNAASALPNSTDNLESAKQAVASFRNLLDINRNVLLRGSAPGKGGTLPPVQTKAGTINPNF